MPPGGPAETTDPRPEAANPVPVGQMEPTGISIPDKISELAGFAPDVARSPAEVVAAGTPVETATEADGDSGGKHGQAMVAPASAMKTELVSFGLRPPLSSAGVIDAEVSAGLSPTLAESPSPRVAGPPEITQRGNDTGARSSGEAPSQEFNHLDEVLGTEACGGELAEGEDLAAAVAEAEAGVAKSTLRVLGGALIVAPPIDSQKPTPEPAMSSIEAPTESVAEAGEAGNAGELVRRTRRPSKPAKHRDRRGQRRALPLPPLPALEELPPIEADLRTSAEAKLRLMLHPIRRAATLSAVLARPAGYPDRVTLLLDGQTEINAFSEDRYDDVDLEWTTDLLSREIRLDCKEGYQWVRSGRRIHIFSEVADEPGVVSTGSAALTSASTIICLREDAATVGAAAEACGSPALVPHDYWSGIPDGWAIFSGYRPTHAAALGLTSGLKGLDPGVGSEIRFSGGLRVRSTSFAEGSPPRIEIVPFPSGAIVTIDGQPGELGEDGAWRAEGWDRPGDHLVDVVPGPSATYRVLADPWSRDGWETWDAHPERFSAPPLAPWAIAQICGAAVSGPDGEHVVAAADAMLSVVCLGLRRGAAALRGRPDAPVAVGLLSEPPAFLISASGPRRSQGRIIWLSPSAPSPSTRRIDPQWVAEVRRAASRRLPFEGGGSPEEDAWRRARERARRHRRPRS